MSTSRLEAFSDGVFAIAITLLILEIKVPQPAESHVGGQLAAQLFDLWPSYLSYITSFITIGIFWANHHNMFRYIKHTDHVLLMLNIFLLMDLSFLPFPTALVAEYVRFDPADEQAAAVVYTGTLVVGAALYNLVWWYAARNRRLVDPSFDAQLLNTITRRNLLGPVLYGVAFMLTFIYVPAGLLLCSALAVLYALPGPAGHGHLHAGTDPAKDAP